MYEEIEVIFYKDFQKILMIVKKYFYRDKKNKVNNNNFHKDNYQNIKI